MFSRVTIVLLAILVLVGSAGGQEKINVTKLERLTPVRADVSVGEYHGRRALKIRERLQGCEAECHSMALARGLVFRDGTIELDVAGVPAPSASETARGFVGVAFRVSQDASGQPNAFEYIYIRPTNGRADDQLRRNHSTQYASHPDYPWNRLRSESPGVYESYADIEAGEWMHIKIVVHGRNALLFVNRAPQPCLIVHDLKLGEQSGGIALWIGREAVGYFSNLEIKPEP